MRHPEFIIFTGPMFGSKTTRLMAVVDRFKYQNRKVLAFKPMMDDRYNQADIVTHNGGKITASTVQDAAEIFMHLAESDDNYDVVAVDEAFMISGIADVLIWLYQRGITVVVSSLDMSATCKPFEELQKMLPWATQIEKCPAVCPVCSRDAYYTYKKNDDGVEIAVGGAELYEPRCFDHHPIMNKREYNDTQP
jgi:thymidine kinase|tara:strand:- start:28977 stop:29555 length:579 start_codon:yes stop_codon:yes gene_type:complete